MPIHAWEQKTKNVTATETKTEKKNYTWVNERTCVHRSTRFVIVPSAEEGDDEELAQQSDVEYNRRSGPRRKKRQRWRGNANGNGNGILSRRRARSSASGVGNYLDSEEEEEQEQQEAAKGGDGGRRRGAVRRGRGAVGGRRRAGRGGGISEVTFFTHLKFSAYLPDFQEMEACRHFVGPLHILQVWRGGCCFGVNINSNSNSRFAVVLCVLCVS